MARKVSTASGEKRRSPQERHWIITAYLASMLAPGGVEWQRT